MDRNSKNMVVDRAGETSLLTIYPSLRPPAKESLPNTSSHNPIVESMLLRRLHRVGCSAQRAAS